MVNKIGILALQGSFSQHKIMLDRLGANNILVRYPNEFDKCDDISFAYPTIRYYEENSKNKNL